MDEGTAGSPGGKQGGLSFFCSQALAPSMDWLEFLSFLLSPLELSDSEPVVVYGMDYLQQVSELINHTEPRYGGDGVRPLCRPQAGTEHRELAQPDTEGFDKALDIPDIRTECLCATPLARASGALLVIYISAPA